MSSDNLEWAKSIIEQAKRERKMINCNVNDQEWWINPVIAIEQDWSYIAIHKEHVALKNLDDYFEAIKKGIASYQDSIKLLEMRFARDKDQLLGKARFLR